MDTDITIDAQNYTKATLAAKHFGYTKDYLLLLIKEGKIDGKKIGNRWYVNIPSAEVFFKYAEKARIERRKKLSEDRKSEFKTHTQKSDGATLRQPGLLTVAVLQTLVVVIIALTVGVAGYVGTTGGSDAAVRATDPNFFERVALALYRVVAPAKIEYPQVVTQETTGEVSQSIGASDFNEIESGHSLVVIPEQQFDAATAAAVEEAFSDEVTVTIDPNDPKTGVVTPVFKDAGPESYRFIMVPVDPRSEE